MLRPMPALVLVLAAGAMSTPMCALAAAPLHLTPAQVASLKAQQPARVAQASASLLQLRSQLGLDSKAGFVSRAAFTNPQGRTVARFRQTYEGRRVWGGEAIVHVEPEGEVHTVTAGVKAGIALQGSPKLSAEQAQAIALRNLASKGAVAQPPKVEAVVFPTRFTGGLASRFDAAKKKDVFDPEMSVSAKAPTDPYVWAYEVRTLLANKLDGHKEITFIVDAGTGAILRKWNAVQGDTPVTGTGSSYYRGTVSLSTAQAGDGTFALNALDRGTLPQPYVASQGGTQTGMQIYYAYADMNTGQTGFLPYAGHAANTWGDGTIYSAPWDYTNGGAIWDISADGTTAVLRGALTPAGETAAVDAHFGLSATWDFYKNVFGRNGIDDQGTSTLAIVHEIAPSWAGAAPLVDNAMWEPWYFGMSFGDGTYPDTPWGMKAVTELDITGHELSHGVTEYSAGLIYEGASGAMNESNSDFFGKMVQAYVGGGGTGATIPEFPAGDLTQWEVGHNSVPTGSLRYMYKPSLDGVSVDGWFDGMEMLDVHFTSGLLNRGLYFLSQGASSDPASLAYSPYLPSGFTGLGNDAAARIWYKTLTEHLLPDADYDAARAGAILSAQELFGAGSAEELAVMQAFAAVNVGTVPGQAPRVRVSFPVVHPAGSFLDVNVVPPGALAKVQLFPTRTQVQVSCDVQNTTNTALTWSMPAQVGTINADGTWTTPAFPFYGDFIRIQANSQADPAQFARGNMILVEDDADTDNEIDALDLGAIAMSWGVLNNPRPAAHLIGWGPVDDWDLLFFGESFHNAFPAQ